MVGLTTDIDGFRHTYPFHAIDHTNRIASVPGLVGVEEVVF